MNISSRAQQAMAVSGMLAPLAFIALAGAATFLTSDYNLLAETVSRLAAPGRPYWWLASASFVVYALLVQPLGPLLYAWSPSRSGGMILWLLVVKYGAGATLAAVYRAGDQRIAFGAVTAEEVHYISAQMGLLAIVALCFVTPIVLRGLAEWRRWRLYSLGLGVLTITFMVPFYFETFPEARGLVQRGFFVTTLLWVFGTSLHLHRLAARSGLPRLLEPPEPPRVLRS